jgi:hypothetical protein
MRLAEYPDDIGFATAIGIAAAPSLHCGRMRGLPANLVGEARIFRHLGISKPLISALALRAADNGTTLEAELLASGAVSETTYYEALAETLALPFLCELEPERVVDLDGADSQFTEPTMLRLHFPSRPPITAIVPSARKLDDLRDRLGRLPSLRAMLAVTSPSALRAALWQAGGRRRTREATDRLFVAAPEFSARVTFWGRQGFYTGLILSALAAFAILFPVAALLLLHLVLSLIFLAAFLIRFQALVRHGRPAVTSMPAQPVTPRPVYSVFVALYREAVVVPQLVATLDRLAWPRTLLDIKLICEADDRETIDALRAARLGPQYEIVEVPPSLPRTKPKALTYALPAARGEFLVIYDAEDRIDPYQLEEAWRTFAAGPETLACLQAPLVVTNARESWLSALFALEYAGLFRGLLPLLAASRLPMPLGGTSNHFRGLM